MQELLGSESSSNYRSEILDALEKACLDASCVISPDFPLELTGFFLGKHLIHFFGAQDEGFSDFRSTQLHSRF